ncbi:MAG: hypothetical protein ACKVVT_09545 [Dehalococcoidia bacterium]
MLFTLAFAGTVLGGLASLGGRTSHAQPAPPGTFAGRAFFVAVPAASGTYVEARIQGATCGVDRVFVANGESRYAMHVKAAGPEGGPCGTPGARVDFFLGGIFAGSSPWESGLSVVDLYAIRPPEGGQGPGATPTPAGSITPVPSPTPAASPTPRPPNTGPGDGTVVPVETPAPDPCAQTACATYQLGRDGKRKVGQAAAVRLEVRLLGQTSISDRKRVQGVGVTTEQRPACTDAELESYAATGRLVFPVMVARLLPADGVTGLTVSAGGQSGATGWRSPQQVAGGGFRWDWGLTAASPGTFEYKVEVSDRPDGEVHADWFCAVEFAPAAPAASNTTSTAAPTTTTAPTASPSTSPTSPTASPTPCGSSPCNPGSTDGGGRGFPLWPLLVAIPAAAGLAGGGVWWFRHPRRPVGAAAAAGTVVPVGGAGSTTIAFLSYRRGDGTLSAAAIARELETQLGPHSVFHDMSDLRSGKYGPAIQETIAQCPVFIALIGPKWAGPKDDAKDAFRIQDPGDPVRNEVAQALATGKFVIPVTFDGASFPGRDLLPPDLIALREWNNRAIDGRHYASDIKDIVDEIRNFLASTKAPPAAETEGSAS